MKDKESGYPLSFILTEWELCGGLALELGCTEADTPI